MAFFDKYFFCNWFLVHNIMPPFEMTHDIEEGKLRFKLLLLRLFD